MKFQRFPGAIFSLRPCNEQEHEQNSLTLKGTLNGITLPTPTPTCLKKKNTKNTTAVYQACANYMIPKSCCYDNG